MSPAGTSDLMSRPAAHGVPLWLKVAYTAFMAVLVPVYWYNYGPTNFLYFCDVALLLTLAGIWLEHPLPISMSAVGITVPQLVWLIDFVGHFVDAPLNAMTAYMFEPHRSLFLRGLSTFHGWLPIMLVYLVARLGYDRRALVAWTVLAWILILICYWFMPPPSPDAGLTPVNINYVFGLNDSTPQTWVSPTAWVIGLMVGMPLVCFLPIHLLLARFMPRAPG